MAGSVDPALVSVLTRRSSLLERLSAEPARKCALVDELDVSRSTIDRGVRELERYDLVEREGRAYRTTLAGELATEEFDRFAGRLASIVDASEVLTPLPDDAAIDPTFLADATVVTAARPDPHEPVRELEALIGEASRHRVYAPAFLSHVVDTYRDAILDGLECEFALTPTVYDRLLSNHGDAVVESLDTGRVDLYEVPEALPYSLVVSRGADFVVAAALVYVDEGLKGSIYNDAPDAVSWAESTLDDIWRDATPISIGGRNADADADAAFRVDD